MALPPRVPLTKDVDVVAWMRGEGLQADLIERVKGSLSGEVLLSEQDRISLGKLLRELMGIAPMDAFAIASKVYPTASGPPPVQPSASTKKRKDFEEVVRNVVKEEMTNMKEEMTNMKEEMTNMKEEIKAEKVERAVKRPYSPLPSGARIREPESLRCVSEAMYWDNLLPKVQARELSFPAHLPAPAVPQLQLCTSEKRPKEEKFKIHSDHCHDECKPCTWSSEAVVQAYWRLQLLPLLQPQMKEARLVDRHKQMAIPRTSSTNELAPDLVLYCDKMEDIDFYIQSVGEIKFSDSITSKHCGQLAKYAQALFELHPHRSILYGWLATQSKMRLFRFKVQPDRQIGWIETSQDLDYQCGLQQLCTMLRLGALELGLFAEPIPMPDMPGVGLVPQRHLGRGSFATAYAATSPQKEHTVVIKLFRSDEAGAAALRCEETTLKKLREHNVKGVTTLVGAVCYPPTQPQPTVLVVQPEGVTVEHVLCGNSPYRLAHDNICKLLHILRDVHKAEVVHCDLSLSNMYFLSQGEMFINDFGSAVSAGALARKGNPYFMPLQVLESASEEYVATPAHDLETFVKVLFYGTNRRVITALEHTPPEKKQLSEFWREREAEDRNLRQQLEFARALKYAELAEELKVYGSFTH